MPTPSLNVDWRSFQDASRRLQALLPTIAVLPPVYRKLVAEIVMIRLFLLLENTFASVAAKIVCGASYLDATLPARVFAARSMAAAVAAMKSHGRTKPKSHLWWARSSEIRANLQETLNSADPFFGVVSKHGSLLTEMRFVRNHIAHANTATRVNFRKVIVQYFGGRKKGVTPGLLLLTPALGPTCVLERYVISSRVLVRELLRA